ncbi:25929_t:CDS:2, partial [Gigaspora margarita]
PNLIIEFIPNEKLKINPNYIAKGSYSEIYKAIWTDGPFDKWNDNKKVLERTRDHNVVLKKLKESNKSTCNWLNEIISHFTVDKIATNIVRCYGLTKDKDSGDFSLILDVMDCNLQEYLIKNNSKIGWKDRCRISYKIAHCLNAIHNMKSVHRDLHSASTIFKKLYSLCQSFTTNDNMVDKKIEICTDKSDDLKNLLSGEGPGNFIRAEVQLPEVISSGEGPGNFLKSRIYSFQNLTEPSNFTKECDFNNIEILFDTDSSDFGFEKVDNAVESFESLRYYDTTDKEYVAIIKESRQKESSQERINENYSNAQANENQKMSRIIDLSFLIFSKLHNEGFNEEDINRNIEKYITMNDETPR